MTKKPSKQASQIAVGFVVLVVLCCGGVTLKSAFDAGEDEPGPAVTAPRFVEPAVAATSAPTVPETSAAEPAPTPKRTSARPKPTPTKPTPTKPKPTPTKPKPKPTTEEPTAVYYKNCAAVRAAGAAPIHRGDPGYAKHLDRDGDGIGCE